MTPPNAAPNPAPVEVSVTDGVAVVRLNRPPMNPIDTAMREALITATRRLADDPDVRACVVSGGPEHFAAGADIERLAEMTFEDVVGWNARLQQALTAITVLPFPVVAAVNGYALGGGLELALAADVRIGSRQCTIGLPEITLGIIPGAGGTQRLTQIVGRSTAKMLILTGRHVHADEALQLGLLDQLVEPADTESAALDLARTFAAGPRFATRAVKEAVDAALPVPSGSLALERSLLAGTFATSDRDTAMRAFLDRRRTRRAARGGASREH
jgi:enoyl-CoA hydratase/carnithine racemase